MKIFPENHYSIELNNDSELALVELKNRTLSKEQFVTNWSNQTFIGEIQNNKFEIKLSKKLIGEFCILNGKLDSGKLVLKITTGKILKIIFVAVVLFILSGIIISIIQNKFELIFKFVVTIVIIRFVFLEFGFRIVSKKALIKLTEIIGIKKISVA